MTGLYQVMKSSSGQETSFRQPSMASLVPSTGPDNLRNSTSLHEEISSTRTLSGTIAGENVDQRHYILLLPPSDCFSEVATRVSSDGMLPTFASVGSHNGVVGFGLDARSKSAPPPSFFSHTGAASSSSTWRLKHNIVRAHVFQGPQWHKIVSRRLKKFSADEAPFAVSLTGLTGSQADLQITSSSAKTLLHKLRHKGERPIGTPQDLDPLATVTIAGGGSSSGLLPPGAAPASQTINVMDVAQYGNLTIFFVSEAIGVTTRKVTNGSMPRAPTSPQLRPQSTLSPPASPRGGIISGSGGGSQVWWQRVAVSASKALLTPPRTRNVSLVVASSTSKMFAPFTTDRIDQEVLQMFKKDERMLVTIFQEIAESRGVSTDEVMTMMDTEIAIFNSSYMCMAGYEKFTVSKVEQMVDSAMDAFIDAVDRCVAATVSTRPARKRVSGSLKTPPGSPTSSPVVVSTAAAAPTLALKIKSALKGSKNSSKNKLDEFEQDEPPRYRQATLDPNALPSDDDCDSNQSCHVTRESLVSEDDEEQVYMVLHTVVTSGIAKKLNAHWGSINSAEDYAFYHACLSLRQSLDTTILDFVPPACASTISISSFEKCFKLCKVVDSPDAGVFTCLRAMESTIASIVDVVNEHSTCKQDVTADVCIPLVVVVLIGACLCNFPSRLRLLLELMLPVVELSSLGYALTTFEASSEQIFYEYSLFVQNKVDD